MKNKAMDKATKATKTAETTVRIDPRLAPAVEQMQAALDRVEAMEVGGDLEGVIEEEIERMTREFYQQALERRQAGLGERAEDFSPGGLPAVRAGERDAGVGAPPAAPGADASRDDGL